MGKRIGIQILSYNRPDYLRKTIESLLEMMSDDDKIAVVEQSDQEGMQEKCIAVCQEYPNIHVMPLFKNFGQRGATNLLYESGFWKDCNYVMLTDQDNLFHFPLDIYCKKLDEDPKIWVASGYHSPEHDIEEKHGEWVTKSSARAGHMVLRKTDFDTIMPSDPKAGEAAWFAGLDWWITHWAPNAPGHKRPGIIACYPGGAEHIGRDSTWQGYYDDEYSLEDHKMVRESSLYDVIKRFPPKHKYIKDSYWYEKISDDEFKSRCGISSSSPEDDEIAKLEAKLAELKKKQSEPSILETNSEPINIDSSVPNVIAFNYLWPKYGLAFLESSIKSVCDHVQKYILFLNKYSYIGEECDPSDLEFVQDIAKKFKNVEVRYNPSSDHPESVKSDNIGHYFAIAGKFAAEQNIDYVWLVQTDEVYDDDQIVKVKNTINTGALNNKAAILQPLCYIDNPHWVVDPPEVFTRPTIISVNALSTHDYDYNQTDRIKIDITFHHLSQVLRRYELMAKYKNWGHRDNVKDSLPDYIYLMDHHKTNKLIANLHPVQPDLYKGVKFVNEKVNRDLMLDWYYHLLTYKNPYDSFAHIFDDTINDFPETPEKQFTLSTIERKFMCALALEALPSDATIMEYGAWNGYPMWMMKTVSPESNYYAMDNYGKPDKLFQQYGDQMSSVYQMAVRKMIQYNLPNTHVLNGNTKLPCIFNNHSLDCLFVNMGINANNIFNLLVEARPKMKHGGIIVGHYSMNDDVRNMIPTVMTRGVNVNCPWGDEVFDYFEIYTDIIGDISRHRGVKLEPQFGLWFARVKRL